MAAPIRAVFANPIVGREFKTRLRSKRTYVAQGVLIGLLFGIVGIVYMLALGVQRDFGMTDVQMVLQTLYLGILSGQTALVCLAAPTLTATAIVGERERKTLDLLTSSPVRAGDLLVGKLMAAASYMALLLAMTLPAASIGILAGGATPIEAALAYLIILTDATLLAAIALFISVYAKSSGNAIAFSFFAAFVFLAATFPLAAMSFGSAFWGMGYVMAPLASLNPFAAAMIADTQSDILGLSVPVWVVTVVVALALIRLLVTLGSIGTGLQSGNAVGSARRQGLLVFLLLILVGAAPIMRTHYAETATTSAAVGIGLLTAVSPWIACHAERRPGWFRGSGAFRADPTGSLPFLLIAAAWLTFWSFAIPSIGAGKIVDSPLASFMLGMALFAWGLCRFISAFDLGLGVKRFAALFCLTAISALPATIASATAGYQWREQWLYQWSVVGTIDRALEAAYSGPISVGPSIGGEIWSVSIAYALAGLGMALLAQRVRMHQA
ncbi:MAG: ABC transporter permease subunit [Armatimonadetes bacterium]|nr:ABC transporter permease subunit [Armatimonadota bacterium]